VLDSLREMSDFWEKISDKVWDFGGRLENPIFLLVCSLKSFNSKNISKEFSSLEESKKKNLKRIFSLIHLSRRIPKGIFFFHGERWDLNLDRFQTVRK